MYKTGTLNSQISQVLSMLGHTDQIVIADCGLPIPSDVPRIDLALTLSTPSFADVYDELMTHMIVEKVVIAQEMMTDNTTLYRKIEEDFPDVETCPHEVFKAQTQHAKAIIRTGEATPYANIILQSGVRF